MTSNVSTAGNRQTPLQRHLAAIRDTIEDARELDEDAWSAFIWLLVEVGRKEAAKLAVLEAEGVLQA